MSYDTQKPDGYPYSTEEERWTRKDWIRNMHPVVSFEVLGDGVHSTSNVQCPAGRQDHAVASAIFENLIHPKRNDLWDDPVPLFNYYRAGHECICAWCGRMYIDHPVIHIRARDGYASHTGSFALGTVRRINSPEGLMSEEGAELHVLCNTDRVKL